VSVSPRPKSGRTPERVKRRGILTHNPNVDWRYRLMKLSHMPAREGKTLTFAPPTRLPQGGA